MAPSMTSRSCEQACRTLTIDGSSNSLAMGERSRMAMGSTAAMSSAEVASWMRQSLGRYVRSRRNSVSTASTGLEDARSQKRSSSSYVEMNKEGPLSPGRNRGIEAKSATMACVRACAQTGGYHALPHRT